MKLRGLFQLLLLALLFASLSTSTNAQDGDINPDEEVAVDGGVEEDGGGDEPIQGQVEGAVRPGTQTGRVCYYGRLVYATIPAGDPRVIKMTAESVYTKVGPNPPVSKPAGGGGGGRGGRPVRRPFVLPRKRLGGPRKPAIHRGGKRPAGRRHIARPTVKPAGRVRGRKRHGRRDVEASHDERDEASGVILALKGYIMKPLLATIGRVMGQAAKNRQSEPWWLSMYETGMCLVQERLTAENEFMYLSKKRKWSAEPVYFVVGAPDASTPIGAYENEIKDNEISINQAKRTTNGLYPWMVPGFEARNRLLRTFISRARRA